MTDVILDSLVTFVGLAVVAAWVWSIRGHFSSNMTSAGATLIKVLVATTTVAFLVLLWWQPQPALPQVIGLFLQLAGAALFWSAVTASREARLKVIFDKDNPDRLISEGPYRRIRHPFYASYLIFWAGFALGVWTPWALAPLGLFTALYVSAAIGEERKFASSPLATRYDSYRRTAGFLWPRLRIWPESR